ncbi:hypothetical protein ACJ72_02217 [Emergomyces africanus]|uniref:Uncharacterized protein n=1 Tax=Emergomyces africanus TaxID=1955775 RepID=A0A1B7P354_9EURO|nr:hypothetical protein ACJ72_02217 [Emergomyces africanus]
MAQEASTLGDSLSNASMSMETLGFDLIVLCRICRKYPGSITPCTAKWFPASRILLPSQLTIGDASQIINNFRPDTAFSEPAGLSTPPPQIVVQET